VTKAHVDSASSGFLPYDGEGVRRGRLDNKGRDATHRMMERRRCPSRTPCLRADTRHDDRPFVPPVTSHRI
jgi:hypothetical protein